MDALDTPRNRLDRRVEEDQDVFLPPPLAEQKGRGPTVGSGASPLVLRALRLVDALARHHAPSADHSLRVATILLAMWHRGPDPALEPGEVAAAGLLHDVGKLNLPLAILDGRTELDPVQRAAVARHPEAGAALLRALGFPPAVIEATMTHHERWDGQGYPKGLSGEAIPPLGRLLAVADSFVAMVEPGRRYRRPRSAAAALAEMRRCSGAQFDPGAVRQLAAALGQGGAPEAQRAGIAPSPAAPLAGVLAVLPQVAWA